MDYAVAGITITGDVIFADGSEIKGQMGGSVFALEGVRLWTKSCLYISNAGPDFPQLYGKWFADNELSTKGISMTMPATRYDVVRYYPDGQYDEYPLQAGEQGQQIHALSTITPAQVKAACGGCKAVYLDSRMQHADWDSCISSIRAQGCKVMWEIPAYIKDPANHKRIWEMIAKVDIYSLNLPESKIFFGVDTEEEAIKKILEMGKPCYYRVGSKGSYMIMDGQVAFAPSIDIGKPVDPTGCGNCSTASAMYCWCEGYDPLMICVMSNIAAAYNIMQYGPYPTFIPEVTAQAHTLAKEHYDKYKAQGLLQIFL